jgi:hypothetical protein
MWPGSRDKVWPRADEKGWFKGPRTLPLIISLVNTKQMRGDIDIAPTYLALLAENRDEGLVEIRSEADMAQLSGFKSDARGLRMWRERIRKLEDIGLVRVFPRGRQPIGFIAMLHPYDVINDLRRENRLSDDGMWNLYQTKYSAPKKGRQRSCCLPQGRRRSWRGPYRRRFSSIERGERTDSIHR